MKEYSLSADWDNNWRTGGNLKEVIEEAHLSKEWQLQAINRFAGDRQFRLKQLQMVIPQNIMEKLEIE